MPKLSAQLHTPAQLRMIAEERIRCSTAPVDPGWSAGAQALRSLHGLASIPASASEALKLLHELQVHQIELSLQREHVDQEQANYLALFDLAPFGYITVDKQRQVVNVNQMACTWLGILYDHGVVHHVEDFLASDCRQAVLDALVRLHEGSTGETFAMQSRANGRHLQVQAAITPNDDLVLMAFMPIDFPLGQ